MEQSVASTVLHIDLRIFGDWIEDEEPMLLFSVRHSSNLHRYMRQRLNCFGLKRLTGNKAAPQLYSSACRRTWLKRKEILLAYEAHPFGFALCEDRRLMSQV